MTGELVIAGGPPPPSTNVCLLCLLHLRYIHGDSCGASIFQMLSAHGEIAICSPFSARERSFGSTMIWCRGVQNPA